MMISHCSFSTAKEIIQENYDLGDGLLCEPMTHNQGYVWYIDNTTLDAVAMYDVMSETLIIDIDV